MHTTTEHDIAAKQRLVATAIRRVLKPIVKLMLSHNITYTLLTDILKSLYIEVADKEFELDGKKQTDSRVSLISGVHRKDVRRLRSEIPSVEEVIPANISLGAQVIAIWNANPLYLDEEGMPKALPRFAGDAKDSFESLVRSVSTDIHPRAVLDEWLRLGICKIDDQNRVHLTTDAFVPQEGFDEKMFYLGHNLHDHAKAAVSNVLGQQPSFLERCVHYEGLSQADIQEIATLVTKHGMKAIREVNKASDALASQPEKSDNGERMRMTFGLYYYYEPDEKDDMVSTKQA
jgi:Family of unknown function (DUF6502)